MELLGAPIEQNPIMDLFPAIAGGYALRGKSNLKCFSLGMGAARCVAFAIGACAPRLRDRRYRT
jgi:hypothetical protein